MAELLILAPQHDPPDAQSAARCSRRAASSIRRRREPAPHGVLRDRSRFDELEQILRPAGLGPDARKFEAAERLPRDRRARAAAVDVQVADAEFLPRLLDVRRAARI